MNSNTQALSAVPVVALVGLGLALSFPEAPLQADSVAPSSLATAAASTPPDPAASAPPALAGAYLVGLFPPASDAVRQGFVRVVNRSDTAGEVRISATDDSGDPAPGTAILSIGPGETAHFNSEDLKQGNPDKDLSGGAGTGNGDWRLELTSDLDLDVLSFIRTEDGFLTAMHDVVEQELAGHRVAIFNPGRNEDQKSLLRLINPGAEPVEVTITGTDDAGDSPGRGVTTLIPPGGATTLTAVELESGEASGVRNDGDPDSVDLDGSLGVGMGKWQLLVMSEEPITVMNLLQSKAGHLTNLSTTPSTRAPPSRVQRDPRLERLNLPQGFQIRIVTADVVNARQMALAADGTLFVGTLDDGGGQVYAVPDALASPQPEVVALARSLTRPSGIAQRDGDLYVAALNRVLRFPDIGRHLSANATFEVVTNRLPGERHHGWKYIKFGPDGQLYVPVGAPCNICLSDDARFASLLRMDPVTGATDIVAEGIRNTVGFAWHPQTRQLWFTDNGRDRMGDDVPPDEVNVITGTGQHFGYPFVHGADVLDPVHGSGMNPADYQAPVVEIQAHAAVLGADFYTGEQFPPRYRNALFIAEHGSWNRSSKVGYQVSVILFENGQPRYEPFITGWLEGQTEWGRPNDVLVAPDGSLLISDDKFGAVYQVTYPGS